MPAATDLEVGDRVVILKSKYNGRIFKVIKILTKNIRVGEVGSTTTVVAHPNLLRKFNPQDDVATTQATRKPEQVFVVGETVRWKKQPKAIHVVLKQSRETVSIALLGGEEGKYKRVPPSTLTRVRVKGSMGSASEEVPPLGYAAEIKKGNRESIIPEDFSEAFAVALGKKFTGYIVWVERGKKYDKILYKSTTQTHIHCFIGRDTHSVFKAETINKPAAGARYQMRDKRDIERIIAQSDIHGSYLYR